MKKLLYYILVLASAASWHSCKEKEGSNYLDDNAPAPQQVSEIQVSSTPGGAMITYKLPKDKNLSYVKAVYEIQPGVFREAKASFYSDTLGLVGFGDTLRHKVAIYSVGRNEKASAPLSVEVSPLTPPVKSVFETLTLESTFGGVNVTFKNTFQADLAIVVMVDTTGQGIWSPVTTHYTSALNGDFSARGMPSKERRFAVYLRDRWNNKSDTLLKSLTPLYEELIPKSAWKALILPGDFTTGVNNNYVLERTWDDIANVSENIFATKDYATLPQWFTVDMNQSVILSRMKLFQRTSYPYNAVWIKSLEIWGSNNYDAGGGWDNWQLLGRFDSHIPSGSVWPKYTADDMVYQRAGEDFTFNQPVPKVRYIRFKVLKTYGGSGQYQLGEFTFWGQIIP
jgi:hypothetical protein